MTKEAFLGIQSEVLSGGKQLKSILAAHGVPYSTYNYWRNKITSNDGNLPIAPISIKDADVAGSYSTFENVDATGIVLAFPNGLRVHFGHGSEHVLMELLILHNHLIPSI